MRCLAIIIIAYGSFGTAVLIIFIMKRFIPVVVLQEFNRIRNTYNREVQWFHKAFCIPDMYIF